MRNGLMRHITTAVLVVSLQLMATLMTMRRDPVARFQGTTISAMLWWVTRPRDEPGDRPAAGSR